MPSASNLFPVVAWSKLSGPGDALFEDPTSTNTTATFTAEGNYVLQCAAIVGTVTNTAQVAVSVNAPASISLRQGISAGEHPSTYIRSDTPTQNAGTRDQVLIGGGGRAWRSLFSFDLSGIDSNAIIQGASLDIWAHYAGVGTMGTVELHQLTNSFVEGSGDGLSAASGVGTGATWLSRNGLSGEGNDWTSAGGDFDAEVLSSVPGYDATVADLTKTFPSTAGFAAAAQSALSAGEPLNLIMLSPSTEAGGSAFSRVVSDDSSLTDQRPQLTLSYLGNLLPWVSSGDHFATLVGVATLINGTASNATGSVWSTVRGPGSVALGNASQLTTTATFSQPGTYVLRLNSWNSFGRVSDDVEVAVASAPPQLASATWINGQFGFQVNCTSGLTYVVQASTNLLTWTNLITTNAVEPQFWWIDNDTSDLPVRFYRVNISP